jgi:hypothetical protein
MPIEPKTIRETNFVIAGLDARLGLIQKMVWVVVGLLGTLLAGAAALYYQVGDLRTDVATIKTDLSTVKGQTERLTSGLQNFNEAQSNALDALRRIEGRVGTSRFDPQQPRQDRPVNLPLIELSDSEIQIIRDVLKPTRNPGAGFKLGEIISGTIVPFLPSAITEKIPKLQGIRYSFDADGAIALVDGTSYRVIKIIAPS